MSEAFDIFGTCEKVNGSDWSASIRLVWSAKAPPLANWDPSGFCRGVIWNIQIKSWDVMLVRFINPRPVSEFLFDRLSRACSLQIATISQHPPMWWQRSSAHRGWSSTCRRGRGLVFSDMRFPIICMVWLVVGCQCQCSSSGSAWGLFGPHANTLKRSCDEPMSAVATFLIPWCGTRAPPSSKQRLRVCAQESFFLFSQHRLKYIFPGETATVVNFLRLPIQFACCAALKLFAMIIFVFFIWVLWCKGPPSFSCCFRFQETQHAKTSHDKLTSNQSEWAELKNGHALLRNSQVSPSTRS